MASEKAKQAAVEMAAGEGRRCETRCARRHGGPPGGPDGHHGRPMCPGGPPAGAPWAPWAWGFGGRHRFGKHGPRWMRRCDELNIDLTRCNLSDGEDREKDEGEKGSSEETTSGEEEYAMMGDPSAEEMRQEMIALRRENRMLGRMLFIRHLGGKHHHRHHHHKRRHHHDKQHHGDNDHHHHYHHGHPHHPRWGLGGAAWLMGGGCAGGAADDKSGSATSPPGGACRGFLRCGWGPRGRMWRHVIRVAQPITKENIKATLQPAVAIGCEGNDVTSASCAVVIDGSFASTSSEGKTQEKQQESFHHVIPIPDEVNVKMMKVLYKPRLGGCIVVKGPRSRQQQQQQQQTEQQQQQEHDDTNAAQGLQSDTETDDVTTAADEKNVEGEKDQLMEEEESGEKKGKRSDCKRKEKKEKCWAEMKGYEIVLEVPPSSSPASPSSGDQGDKEHAGEDMQQ